MMEVGFFALVGDLYKILAFIVLGCIALSSIIFPLFVSAEEDTPAPLLLYLFTPLIIAGCIKLMQLIL